MSRLGSFHDDDPAMTIETGSNRHPSGGHIEARYVPGKFLAGDEWQTYRILDPVRAAALTAAVLLTNGAYPPDPGMPVAKHVTDLAALLAQYLTGEEAHD